MKKNIAIAFLVVAFLSESAIIAVQALELRAFEDAPDPSCQDEILMGRRCSHPLHRIRSMHDGGVLESPRTLCQCPTEETDG